MLIGFDAPTRGPLASPEIIARLAVEGEAMGFGYMTISDHIVLPHDIHARYPYSESGEFPAGGGSGDWMEQLTVMSWLAAKTSRLRFLTSVMVVPHRPAVLTAKILASIDVLSGGRITVGCGAGWMKEEFEALALPPFAERGAVTDEYIQAFRELWTKEQPSFDGRYVKFSNVAFAPKPVQQPGIPIWIGGESSAALHRAARLGDGWYPIGSNPKFPLDTMSRYRTAASRVRQLASQSGRDPASVQLGFKAHRHGPVEGAKAGAERGLFTGDAAAIIGDIKAMGEMGVSQIDFRMSGASLEATLDNMKRFRDTVVAKL